MKLRLLLNGRKTCTVRLKLQRMTQSKANSLPKERFRLLKNIENLLEGPMILLGFAWLALLIVELIDGLPRVLEHLSLVIWGLFILDFLLKFILAPAKKIFLRNNWLTAISLLIPALRVFRIVRLFRVIRGIRLVKVVGSLNRSMRSLAAAMSRRGFGYVMALTTIVTLGGAAGMFALEKGNEGFANYGLALWWTAMRVITAGSDFWPITTEGRTLAFLLSLFGYAIFGYVTATLATFFIGRDAEEKEAPIASANDIRELKKMLVAINKKIDELNQKL
jgi:voltage-gated potassium channel